MPIKIMPVSKAKVWRCSVEFTEESTERIDNAGNVATLNAYSALPDEAVSGVAVSVETEDGFSLARLHVDFCGACSRDTVHVETPEHTACVECLFPDA